MPTELNKLLPCPFCGGKAIISMHLPYYNVGCLDCESSSGETFSRDKAIKLWNTRAEDKICQ